MAPCKVKKYFSPISSTSNKCKLCGRTVNGANTSNMTYHFNKWHTKPSGSETNELESENIDDCLTETINSKGTEHTEGNDKMCNKAVLVQKSITSVFDNIAGYKDGGKHDSDITNAIIYMIVKDNLPLNTVDKIGFNHLLKKTVPLYHVPSRQNITRNIDTKYDAIRTMFIKQLHKTTSICLTCDIWTEPHTSRSYFGATVHYLNNEKLQSASIGIKELNESHTSAYILEVVDDLCKEWEISYDKITCVVTDNASSMLKSVRDTFGRDKSLGCFAHKLNLVVQNAMNGAVEFKELLTKVKHIVTYMKSSVKAADSLRKIQLESGFSEGKLLKLKQECPTRWNSAFYMIERYTKLSDIVYRVLLQFEGGPDILTAYQVRVLKEVVNLLQPFELVTKEISADTYITASKIIPICTLLRKKILTTISCQTAEAKSLQEKLKMGFIKKFDEIEKEKVLAISTILDPRFKKIHFRLPIACSNAISSIEQEMLTIEITSNNVSSSQTVSLESAIELLDAEEISKNNKKICLWSDHDEIVSSTSTQQIAGANEYIEERRLYLQQEIIDRKQSPILFWQNSVCINLGKVALKYLCIVGTSVPSERLFSIAGNIITDHRSRLNPKRLEKLVFLSSLDKSYWNL